MTAVYTPDHGEDQAIVRAMTDRWRLGRLLDHDLIRRMDDEYARAHPEVARPFMADIERRRSRGQINLALRPANKKKKRRH